MRWRGFQWVMNWNNAKWNNLSWFTCLIKKKRRVYLFIGHICETTCKGLTICLCNVLNFPSMIWNDNSLTMCKENKWRHDVGAKSVACHPHPLISAQITWFTKTYAMAISYFPFVTWNIEQKMHFGSNNLSHPSFSAMGKKKKFILVS